MLLLENFHRDMTRTISLHRASGHAATLSSQNKFLSLIYT